MSFPLLFDDAAIFPPGNLPLPDAVLAHRAHRQAAYADLVGPLVVRLGDLPALTGRGPLEVAVVVPNAAGAELAMAIGRRLDAIRLVSLEVTEATVAGLREAIGEPEGVAVSVELPRDHRRAGSIADLVGTGFQAKLRTGGVAAAMYPDESELAAALVALTAAEVPFKATAGLHHALRNTDPVTGFEQHGFVNLLAATEQARLGAEDAQVAAVLAERDPRRLLPIPERSLLRSIGTCSISEPVEEIRRLGLVAAG